MTLAFFLDEDAMRNSLLRELRARGIDVTTAHEAGMVRASDEEQLEAATLQSRVLFSFNVADFCRLHDEWLRVGKSHAGAVLAHQWRRYSIGTQLRGLLRLASQRSAAQMRERLEFLSDWI